jgi:hypothetical protein
MSSSLAARRITRLAPFASLLALAACSSVLGIEDLHQGPAPGSGGSSSGGTSNGGTATSGGDGAVGGSSGSSTINGGSGGKGQGGSSAVGGDMSVGGEAGAGIGAGGDGTVGGSTVHGHVIDYWQHKLAGVPVEIGGTKVITDEAGAFTIDNVAAQYDASLVVQYPDNYDGQIYGWVYQGLTRRDPTLQVYQGLQDQSGNVDVTPSGADVTLTGTRKMSVAFGGLDGSWELSDVPAGGYDGSSVGWVGPTMTQETAHGLIWQPDPSTGAPTGYFAYDSKAVALNGLVSDHSALPLNMAAKTITSGNITGTITANGSSARTNGLFLQFTSNAILTLASDNGPNSFSYLVPTITNGSVILAASEGVGNAYDGAYGLVHKDGLAAGTSGITATIPKPATLLTVTPATARNKVDGTTQFAFQPGAGSSGLFVIAFKDDDTSLLKTDALFIVTTKTTFTLPKVVNDSFALIPANKYYWRVETHGTYANADAATGPTGFIDEFGGDFYKATPSGPRRGSGSYTISGYSDVITMAP